jgi:uncharacterized protein involved in exopolysaccharide biosynthesis
MTEILSRLWVDRWLIIIVTLVFFMGGISYVIWGPRWYEAKVVLVPSGAGDGLPASLAQFSGLASLAGINLPQDSDSKTSMAVLRSRKVARQFVEEHGLLTELFSERWDAETGSWKKSRFREEPSLQDAVERFLTRVRGVSEDAKNGTVSLTMTWRDAGLAAQWANDFVRQLNEWLKADASVRASENIEFLKKELTDSPMPAMQQPLGRLLESEMQKLLLARGNRDFAFRVVDPAVVPRKPATPALAVLFLSLVVGGVMGVSASLARWVVRDIGRIGAHPPT